MTWRAWLGCLVAAVATLCTINYTPAVLHLPLEMNTRVLLTEIRGVFIPILLFRAAIELWYPL